MSEDAPVYADTDTGQLALPGADELGALFFTESEKQGKYTAERLKSSRPQQYETVSKLLGAGCSSNWIRQLTGMHFYTIQAVAVDNKEFIEQEKERTASMMKYGRHVLADKLTKAAMELEINNWTDAQRAAVINGILTEKAELLSGGVTSRVARKEERLEDVEEHFSNLPDPDTAIEADFSEITGFDGQADGPKEPGGSEEVDADQESGDLNLRTTDNQ